MKTAFVFPGQASQFEGMGKDLHENSAKARELYKIANDIMGFDISDVMFHGSAEDLMRTDVTQPAVFLHSAIKLLSSEDIQEPDAVAGHSLGEFSALVANGVLSFEDGLKLVKIRAEAMQKACLQQPGTMAAILGMEDQQVIDICEEIGPQVSAANFNCPGQLVISGTINGINLAVELLKERGAKRALVLSVGGAFHSELMAPAREELREAILNTTFSEPRCPIYQNIDGKANIDVEVIKQNLIGQLTSPVRWTQTMQHMITDGIAKYIEIGGSGKVITGLLKKMDRSLDVETL